LSNVGQLGVATKMYVEDYDDRIFVRASTAIPSISRSGAVIPSSKGLLGFSWWNGLMPYVRDRQAFACPSDPDPVSTKDIKGIVILKRSYSAMCSVEALAVSQVSFPAETTVFMDKWDKTAGRAPGAITSGWIEPFNGDLDYYPTYGRMARAGDRHQQGLNASFFDGHAKWLKGQQIRASKNLTGCALVNTYPIAAMCDIGDVKCMNTGIPDNTDPNHPIPERNICDTFTWP
jgi:prepilin-type processing-associated H-X9-DG protein